MLDYIKKLLRRRTQSSGGEGADKKISSRLDENIETMKGLFRGDCDFCVREFIIPAAEGLRAAVFFIDGLAGAESVNANILSPLMIYSRTMEHGTLKAGSLRELYETLVPAGEVEAKDAVAAACGACLAGDSVLMADGFTEHLIINTKGFLQRSVTEPQTETVVRGAREGFTEVLRVNTSLIRRKLKTEHLRMETMTIGRNSGTLVCLTYLDNVCNPELVEETRRRLRTIDTDFVPSSGFIEELIEDAPMSMFPTINHTEKPDIAAAKLAEGRCALIIDGTPFVLTLPMIFVECFQSPEDYAIRSHYAVFLRLIRLAAFFLSLVAPAVYVALTSFHQELIPTPLLFTIASSGEKLPFPSAIETAVMLVTFEILKEAGVRLPRPVGQAVSIVGALVMGQAAIQAGIVGAPVVIVIAFTAVASFLSPNIADTTAIIRWYLLLLGSCFGGFGITIGLMTILIHLASLKSFGTDYLYPFAPLKPSDMKDTLVRVPFWKMRTRPAAFSPQDVVRQNSSKPEFGESSEE